MANLQIKVTALDMALRYLRDVKDAANYRAGMAQQLPQQYAPSYSSDNVVNVAKQFEQFLSTTPRKK